MLDYNSDSFQQLLSRYETAQRGGCSCYLDSDEYVDLSDYYLDMDQPERALEVAEQGLRMHPDDELLPSVRAGVLIYLKRFDEAEIIVDQLEREGNKDVKYLRGQLAYGMENNPEVADAFFKTWTTEMEEEWQSAVGEDDADPDEAEDEVRNAFMHVIMSFVELGDSGRNEAGVNVYARRWTQEYLDRYQEMGKFDADFTVADICRDEAWLDLVEEAFSRLLDNDPYMPNGWTILAAAQQSQEKYEEAINSLGFALAINPDDAVALLTQAHTIYGMQNYADALPVFLKYRRVSDSHSEDQYIAYCYMVQQEAELALSYWKSAYEYVQTEPDMDDEQRAWKLYEVSDGLMNLHQDELSGEAIDMALALEPDNIDYQLQKGCVLLASDQLAEASDLFRKLVSDHSEYFNILLFAIAIRYIAFNYPILGEVLLTALQAGSGDNKDFPQYDSTFAYLAFAKHAAGSQDGLLFQLYTACLKTPELVKQLFADYLPDTVLPQDYFDYLEPQIIKKTPKRKRGHQ